jgi:hypothetical protein
MNESQDKHDDNDKKEMPLHNDAFLMLEKRGERLDSATRGHDPARHEVN